MMLVQLYSLFSFQKMECTRSGFLIPPQVLHKCKFFTSGSFSHNSHLFQSGLSIHINGIEQVKSKLDPSDDDDVWLMHEEKITFREGLNSIILKSIASLSLIRYYHNTYVSISNKSQLKTMSILIQ
jgi:hypothetical protein